MPAWTYELAVPDDAPATELDGYRELAIATWHTAVEAAGWRPGEPDVELVALESPPAIRDRATGDLTPGPRRRWRVMGDGR